MAPEEAGCKAGILAALLVVLALWASVAIAGVNEDLIKAALRGDLPAVKRFIAKGADVNAKDCNGGTALIAASQDGRLDLVQALIAEGADVNAKMDNGLTALIPASERPQRGRAGAAG